MDKIMYAIWFASLEVIPRKKFLLFQMCHESFIEVYHAKKEILLKVEGIDFMDIYEIESKKEQNYLHMLLDKIHQNKISLITWNDEIYPAKLKMLYDPPLVLFAKGDLSLLQKNSIAIVGSRLADSYGKKISYDMASSLSYLDFSIISGLAMGIDTMAHLGALRNLGSTIAVIGCGLDIVYPRENEGLYRAIFQKGLILSELVPGTKPLAKHFPMRNRIISGLSEGVLVVEAKEKSGAMITVDFALEQGKNVYAIPGNIHNELCKGCCKLLKEGAKMVTCIDDILEDYGISIHSLSDFHEKYIK